MTKMYSKNLIYSSGVFTDCHLCEKGLGRFWCLLLAVLRAFYNIFTGVIKFQ